MAERRLKNERRQMLRPGTKDRRILLDRRRKKRYRVKEGAFAALINHDNRLGQIRDISLVGLSFRYIDGNGKLVPAGDLKIILAGGGLFLENLPYHPVNDYEVRSGFTFSPLRMRQMHLAFGDLTSDQLSKLDYFILNHTMGEA
jgi:hypothetical protein